MQISVSDMQIWELPRVVCFCFLFFLMCTMKTWQKLLMEFWEDFKQKWMQILGIYIYIKKQQPIKSAKKILKKLERNEYLDSTIIVKNNLYIMTEKNHQKYVLEKKQRTETFQLPSTPNISSENKFSFKGHLTKNCCLTENELSTFLQQFTSIPFDVPLCTILLK